MEKIRIDMLSKAESVDGQGVGSAYLEQVALVKEGASDLFDIRINARKGKFDIYHHHTVNPTHYLKMNRRKAVHVCYVHFLPITLDGSIKLPRLIFHIFKKYVVRFYKKAHEIVVVNPIFIEPLTQLGIRKENITYIPNYVSKESFHPNEIGEIKRTKQKYGIPEGKFIVLGVGQVQTRKGVLDFIETAKMNQEQFFVWAGGFSFGKITDGYKELKEIFENPPANVRFLGIIKRTEMNDIFNASDVLFMPSYNELFPMSILEAVNSLKPLVLRNLELYEDILFRKYLSGKDNREFSALLRNLETDKSLYERESENSRYISEYYSKENVLSIWREYYPRILAKHKK